MFIRFHFFIFLASLMLACKPSQDAAKPASSNGLALRPVASSMICGISEPREVYITNAEAWAALWAEVGSRQVPAPALPAVDFSKEVLLACFAGAKSTGGHSIAIDKVTLSGETYQVHFVKTRPGKNCMVTEAFTYPYQIVAVPAVAGAKAVFTGEEAVKDCQ